MNDPVRRTRDRRVDAARNDAKILAAAREVFTELGVDAPVSAIAARAGVGMNSLYRRWASKEELVRALAIDTMRFIESQAENALGVSNPWDGFVRFVQTCVQAGVDGSPRLTGAYVVTDEVLSASKTGREAVQRLVELTQAHGELRADINAHDIVVLISELRNQRVSLAVRPAGLSDRLLAITLDGLRATNAAPLPAPPASWDDVARSWLSIAPSPADP